MRWLFLVVFLAALTACKGEKQKDVQNEISVKTLNHQGLEKLISNHSGKILFLNVWATWCVPCREEFPDLVRLADAYSKKNIAFAAISADYPDEIETRRKPVLKKMKANFPMYVQNFKKQETLINRLNPEWNGALPASFIFDRNGNRVAYLPGKHSFKEFSLEIDKFLE